MARELASSPVGECQSTILSLHGSWLVSWRDLSQPAGPSRRPNNRGRSPDVLQAAWIGLYACRQHSTVCTHLGLYMHIPSICRLMFGWTTNHCDLSHPASAQHHPILPKPIQKLAQCQSSPSRTEHLNCYKPALKPP